MRLPVPSESGFTSRLRSPAVASRVGLWLGVCFAIAFLTGVFSHLHQDTPGWLTMPTRPVWLYQVTQGLHVVTGTAAVPLLLVKLWSVYPRLFQLIPLRGGRKLLVHLLERGSIAVLVSAALFQLVTGLANSSVWYPWAFSFRSTHYAVAWVAIGALLLHIAVKLPVIRDALTSDVESPQQSDRPSMAGTSHGLTRRGLLRTTWLASGVAVVGTAGIAVPWLRDVSVFGVRSGRGPQGVPVNKAATEAGVVAAALASSYRLRIVNGTSAVELTRSELEAMSQSAARLPIACVEGWSATADWSGVRIRDLAELVGARGQAAVGVTSLQQEGPFTSSELPPGLADDPLTLLALRVNGEDLSLDHGFPCRLIAPGRPGVLQTKWVAALEVRA